MSERNKHLTEAQQKAAAFLTRPKPDFEAWRDAQAAVEAKALEKIKVGDTMSDGTIYAGISPDTNERMYVAAKGEKIIMDFNEAAGYAATLDAHDHKDWRVPTKEELDVLFRNSEKGALKGTFTKTVSYPGDYYWSSMRSSDSLSWQQAFSNGQQYSRHWSSLAFVRCVRS